MKLQIMSDLHLTHGHNKLPKLSKEADVLVVAGDIHSLPEKALFGFQKILNGSSIPAIFVLGNHDFYQRMFETTVNSFSDYFEKFPNFYLLEKDVLYLGGIKFVGTTLWTDLNNGTDFMVAYNGMSDYSLILKKYPDGSIGNVTPNDTYEEHTKCLDFLNNNVTVGEKTVVITHHLPSYSMCDKRFVGSRLNCAFASNLDSFILDKSPNVWISGHTHSYFDGILGNTRCICNPYGYPSEQYKSYKKELIIEV